MNWKSELDKWFNEHHNEGIELLCELVEKNTTNPPGNEYLVAEVVKKFLSKYNINSVEHEAKTGRTNLLAKIGTGSPVVFVPVHTDVVPAGDGWDTDPFKAVIKDGFIFGRGVADDKGPLVSALLLAAFFKKHENDFNGTYLLGAVADEELGSTLGVSFLLENKLVDADYAIVPDTGAGILKVSAGEKSLLQFEVVFYGRQAHGSTPDKGLNAIWAANEFLNMISDNFDDKAGFLKERKHDLFSPSTLNIGKIEAGNAFNIVPRECKVYIDIRYTPERTREELLSIIKDIADNIKDKGLCDNYIINEKCHMAPFVIDNNHPLIKAISSAVAELTDKTLQPFGMGGTTVCKQLVESGIPAVGFSQDCADQAHRTNERLKISEIGLFGKALGLSFLKIIDYHS